MLIPIAVLGAFITATALAWALQPATDPVAERMLRYAGPVPLAGPAVLPRERTPWRLPRALEAYLLQAGIEPTPRTLATMVGIHLLAGLALGIWLHMPGSGAALGLLALMLRVRRGRGARVEKLAAQLPDALMLLASGTRAGLGFQQALQLAARETAKPLGDELGRLERDLAMGLTTEEALDRLQTRLASTDGEMLCASLLVQRQTGGNLSELLLNLHHTIRDRQALYGQVRTLTAQGRLSGVILCCLPIVLGVLLWAINRAYLLTLFTDPRGQVLAGAAVLSMAIGAWIISRIVRITL
ncbi:MAG: type secretion system protein [Cyanobacteria bacterium RYN_339]|nr:type secretion system protein [Cyanobacteria bacterium RYN_339]